MGDEQHYGSPRFGGDMDRNEVEIDLNKFMALLQEKSELKDRIRELEDEKNDNPYQKFIFVAQAIDSWRIIPRCFLGVYMYLLYFTTFWFIDLPDPTFLSLTEPVPVIEIDSPETSPVTSKSELLTVFVAS